MAPSRPGFKQRSPSLPKNSKFAGASVQPASEQFPVSHLQMSACALAEQDLHKPVRTLDQPKNNLPSGLQGSISVLECSSEMVPEESSSPLQSPVKDSGNNEFERQTIWQLREKFGTGYTTDYAVLGRSSLFALYNELMMLAEQIQCHDVLDPVGLGGPLAEGTTVVLRGHTGFWVGINNKNEIVCNKTDRSSAAAFTVKGVSTQNLGENFGHDSHVELKLMSEQFNDEIFLGIGTDVILCEPLSSQGHVTDTQFTMLSHGCRTIMSGQPIQIRSLSSGKTLEVAGEVVRARTADHGTLQRIVVEKVPVTSIQPTEPPYQSISLDDQAWLLHQGVCHALVDRQALADFLSSHLEGRLALLNAYAVVWEQAWSRNRIEQLDNCVNPSAPSRGSRKLTAKKLYDMFAGGVPEKDRANGDAFVDALRSFFAGALRMSRLEAACVQRVVEAFAAALVADTSFMDAFSASMLPVKDRKTYDTPELMIFGLAYLTTMLNTDLHNQQVSQKVFEHSKFIAAGKTCGMTHGFVQQVYRNIRKEEL